MDTTKNGNRIGSVQAIAINIDPVWKDIG